VSLEFINAELDDARKLANSIRETLEGIASTHVLYPELSKELGLVEVVLTDLENQAKKIQAG
jgi:hypothetical protein